MLSEICQKIKAQTGKWLGQVQKRAGKYVRVHASTGPCAFMWARIRDTLCSSKKYLACLCKWLRPAYFPCHTSQGQKGTLTTSGRDATEVESRLRDNQSLESSFDPET